MAQAASALAFDNKLQKEKARILRAFSFCYRYDYRGSSDLLRLWRRNARRGVKRPAEKISGLTALRALAGP
jgi:hypothetical protein